MKTSFAVFHTVMLVKINDNTQDGKDVNKVKVDNTHDGKDVNKVKFGSNKNYTNHNGVVQND